MKISKIAIPLAILWLSTDPLRAEESLDELGEVHRRESTVNQLSSALFDYNQVVRDLGSDSQGLEAKTRSYTAASNSWISEFRSLSSRLPSLANLNAVGSDIASTIRKQSLGLENLNQQARSIILLCDKSLRKLSLQGKLSTSPAVSGVYSDLEAKRTRTIRSINAVKQKVEATQAKLLDANRLVNFDFFYSKYMAEAIKRGVDSNSPIAAEFREYLKAEIFAKTYLPTFEQKAIEISVSMLGLEGFRLKQLLSDLGNSYQANLNLIQSGSLTSKEKTRLKAELTSIHDKAQTDYRTTILIYSPNALAQSMQKLKVRRNRLVCSQPQTQEACQLYKKLKDIDPEKLVKYDSNGLKELENLWLDMEAKK